MEGQNPPIMRGKVSGYRAYRSDLCSGEGFFSGAAPSKPPLALTHIQNQWRIAVWYYEYSKPG
jgi:hypothetical protein